MLGGQNRLMWFATSVAAWTGGWWLKFAAIWFDIRTRSPRVTVSSPRRGIGTSSSLVRAGIVNFSVTSGALKRARTCTAVTLYSGQLVAQSEYSVVTTLAPPTG